MAILSRVAENLFWIGRYVERAKSVARLVDVTAHLELDAGGGDDFEDDFWTPLLGPTAPALRVPLARRRERSAAVRRHLAFDLENLNSLVTCVYSARLAAREVRESLSSETWEHLNKQYLALRDPSMVEEAEDRPHEFFRHVYDSLVLVQGLVDSTLARDEAWEFVELGTHLERANSVARVLSLQTHLLALEEEGDRDGVVRWLAVLRSCGSAEAYARYYSMRVDPPRVLEFLLLNPLFPQSLRFSLGAAWSAISSISGESRSPQLDVPVRIVGRLRAEVEHSTIDELLQTGLDRFLGNLQLQIASASDAITLSYFRKQPQPTHAVAVERAAMIMAASQQ